MRSSLVPLVVSVTLLLHSADRLSAEAPEKLTAAIGPMLDRSKLGKMTFAEEMEAPISVYDAGTKQGTWETKYWFGDPNGLSSRTWDGLLDIAVDEKYMGLKSFEQKGGELELISYANPRPEDPLFAGRKWTESVLTTAKSFTQLYGYFEMRAAYPDDAGFWPCFWLWSRPGTEAVKSLDNEIDIAESQTVLQGKMNHAAHLRNVWKEGLGGEIVKKEQGELAQSTLDDIGQPHVYGLLWTKEELVWYVDDKEVASMVNPGFADPMFVILSIGVGGWEEGQKPTENTVFPNRLKVDYVRVYELK